MMMRALNDRDGIDLNIPQFLDRLQNTRLPPGESGFAIQKLGLQDNGLGFTEGESDWLWQLPDHIDIRFT